MKKEIWKFKILPGDESIKMPANAEILTIQVQNNIPCIWALVDPKEKLEPRTLQIFGTGHEIPCDSSIVRKYLGTFQIGDTLVFHVFERIT